MLRKLDLLALALSLGLACTVASADPSTKYSSARFDWISGAWYLALDSEPYGVPPGYPLGGLAVFNADGTFQVLDAGDFGQATFTNTQHTTQLGAWRKVRYNKVIGTTLFLEADLASGEVLRWNKVRFTLRPTRDRDVVTGTVNVLILDCSNLLPLPTALTCPDPTNPANTFTEVPPADIPVTLTRVRAVD